MVPSGPHPAWRVAFPIRAVSEGNRSGPDTCGSMGNAAPVRGQSSFQTLRYHCVSAAAPVIGMHVGGIT
jgi:hypothetical protein